MEPTLFGHAAILSIKMQICQKEKEYQKALKSGAEFQQLKEIKGTIRELKNELDWKKSGIVFSRLLNK